MTDWKNVIDAGLRQIKAMDAEAVVVVPSSCRTIDAKTVITADDLFEVAGKATQTRSNATTSVADRTALPRDTVLLFPGSIDILNQSIERGRLPRASLTLAMEAGHWRHLRPVPAPLSPPPSKNTSIKRDGVASAKILKLIDSLREYLWVRNWQRWFDKRGAQILDALFRPGDFPFRMSHYVEKRILLGIGTLGSGGAERQIINTATGLRSRGFDDIHLLVEHLHDAPAHSFYLDRAEEVATVHTFPDHVPDKSGWLLQQPGFRRALPGGFIRRILCAARALQQTSPEIVHTSLDWTNVTLGIAALLAGVPRVVVSGRNLAPTHFSFFQWFMYPAYKALTAHPNVIFTNNSNAGRRDYARWLGVNPRSIKLVRNGLRTEEFMSRSAEAKTESREVLGISPDATVISGAFRLSKEKRPTLWIRTAAEIKRKIPEAVFLLCGVGPLENELKTRAKALGLDGSLLFLGEYRDIQQIFAASDLVMQTSLQEGTPNTLIEAQAMGIPVLTTPAFGAAEAVKNGETGRVVSKETPAALAAAAVELLTGGMRFATAGPAFINERFGLDRMIDDTLETYAELGAEWASSYLPEARRHGILLPLTNIYKEKGHCFACRMPKLSGCSDDLDSPQCSPVMVLEDGKALGPAHTNHTDIIELGGGRFSHWGGYVLFSSSDGTSVLGNGRRYEAALTHRAAWLRGISKDLAD